MTERPILFSAAMVRAILIGQKTQTRRIVKHIPMLGHPDEWKSLPDPRLIGDIAIFCPYGNTLDRLWVRETWKATPEHKPIPNAHNYPKYWYRATDHLPTWAPDGLWKPSIFMPRNACRIRLEIVNVRAERLQDITEADAIAEGVSSVCEYTQLWEKINGDGSWSLNPYVWVVTFKRIEALA